MALFLITGRLPGKMADVSTVLGPIKLKNPFLAASGTFAFGEEYSSLISLNDLGGLIVKGLTLKPCRGNYPPRIIETPAGMLNSIGLENPGLEVFISQHLPQLRRYSTGVIVNIAGETQEEYIVLARELSRAGGITALELNLSCPNVAKGGMLFGTSADTIKELVGKIRDSCELPLIVKLTPNVTDMVELAQAAENGGADILSLINTLRGMVIDVERRRPFLGNITGGLSGPAIRPVAVRAVYEVCSSVNIPVIGIGGIMNLHDSLQFFMAGARAVAVGTANFVQPDIIPWLIRELREFLHNEGFHSLDEIVGLALKYRGGDVC